jgi:hypothetical protein
MEFHPATVNNSEGINAQCNIALLASNWNLLTANLACLTHIGLMQIVLRATKHLSEVLTYQPIRVCKAKHPMIYFS